MGCCPRKIVYVNNGMDSAERATLEYLRRRQGLRPTQAGSFQINNIVAQYSVASSAPVTETMPTPTPTPTPTPEGTEATPSETASTETASSVEDYDIEQAVTLFHDLVVTDYMRMKERQPDLDFGDFYVKEMDFYSEKPNSYLEREHNKLTRQQITQARHFIEQNGQSDEEFIRRRRLEHFSPTTAFVHAYSRA